MKSANSAERMLIDLGISEPKEIDLDAIAWTRGAIVNYRPIDNCEATIVGSKRKAVISINSRSMPERRRFSLAHELGHWHHHRGRILFCGKNDVCNFANDALNPERQADSFASDLILPGFMIEPRLRKMKRPNLAAARELAGEFHASLTAALVKMTILKSFSDDHCLPQQNRSTLVRTFQYYPALVVSREAFGSADLCGGHAVQRSDRATFPAQDRRRRVVRIQRLRSLRGRRTVIPPSKRRDS